MEKCNLKLMTLLKWKFKKCSDSLAKLANTSKNYQKYLLDDRNIILAHHIDSICKTNSLFSGIGAAHLPGENGVIELLKWVIS